MEIVPLSHRQGNCIPYAAIRWHDFGNRPALGRPLGHSPHRRYTNISKPRDYSTSSASKRTRFSSGTLPICLRDLSVARPTMFAVSTPASAIRPDRGTRSAVSWPKWSGTPASWFLASVSSSLICRALPSGWWRSIITVARRSSTSRKARTPSTGPVCHVASSATMPFGSSFTPWPTIWATS